MLLEGKREYIVKEEVEEYDDSVERVPGQGEEKGNETVKVRGSLISLMENLDNEVSSLSE